MTAVRTFFWIATVVSATFPLAVGRADDCLAAIERLAASDPKPFVLVEATGQDSVARAQGVVVSSHGHVLSAGHVSWIEADRCFTDKFRISLRGTGEGFPDGFVHTHKTVFSDREDTTFLEYYYSAKLLQQRGSRFIGQRDLAIFRLEARGTLPKVEFFSRKRPAVELGETVYLCHYNFPHRAADPTFLINPVEVVGVAQTSSGMQYLAEGYYRVGSSGGALLKDGRLIGIQSAAYTINARDIGEIPLGLISFQLVWGELFDGLLTASQADPTEAFCNGTRKEFR